MFVGLGPGRGKSGAWGAPVGLVLTHRGSLRDSCLLKLSTLDASFTSPSWKPCIFVPEAQKKDTGREDV